MSESIEKQQQEATISKETVSEDATSKTDEPLIDPDQANKQANDSENIAEATGDDDWVEKLATAEAKAQEHWDRVLRMQAEMDNQRRRALRDVENAHKFALERFVDELLPVIDSLEMGLTAKGNIEQLHEGMSLTLKQFRQAIEKFDVEVVDPLNEKFNPELHQAMSMMPSAEHSDNTVINVMQKGYTLNDRLVRPAMVIVCKN